MKPKLAAVTANTDNYSGCGTCFYKASVLLRSGFRCTLPRRCPLGLGHNYIVKNIDTRRPLVVAIVPAKSD